MILQVTEGLQVVGEVGDGLALLRFLESGPVRPDLVILDISMPGMQGIQAAHRIRELYPAIKTLILTVHADKRYFLQAFAEGVAGFLSKQDAFTQLPAALNAIRRGKTYFAPRPADDPS